MKRRKFHFGILSTSESLMVMITDLLYFVYFRQEVLAEDETEESDSDEKNEIQRKISYEDQHNGSISRDSRNMSLIDSKLPSRKTSAMNSAANSQAPSRRWSRHSSPTRGEILRMDDEVRVTLLIFNQDKFFNVNGGSQLKCEYSARLVNELKNIYLIGHLGRALAGMQSES